MADYTRNGIGQVDSDEKHNNLSTINTCYIMNLIQEELKLWVQFRGKLQVLSILTDFDCINLVVISSDTSMNKNFRYNGTLKFTCNEEFGALKDGDINSRDSSENLHQSS